MTTDEVLSEFRAAGALLEGHFILSSGLRSPLYMQKMLVFCDPARTERLCRALAAKAKERFGAIDIVVSPAVGGVIPGYETARALGAKAIFVEDVAPILAQMRRDAVGAGLDRGERAAHGIGPRAAARIPQGRDMIDIDAEADATGLRAHHGYPCRPRLPGFTGGMAASSGGSASAG